MVYGVMEKPNYITSLLIKTKKGFQIETLYLGDPPEARTQDPHIKSVMLYLLS